MTQQILFKIFDTVAEMNEFALNSNVNIISVETIQQAKVKLWYRLIPLIRPHCQKFKS